MMANMPASPFVDWSRLSRPITISTAGVFTNSVVDKQKTSMTRRQGFLLIGKS